MSYHRTMVKDGSATCSASLEVSPCVCCGARGRGGQQRLPTLHEATGVGQMHWVEETERGSHAEEPAHAKHKGANIQGHPKGD